METTIIWPGDPALQWRLDDADGEAPRSEAIDKVPGDAALTRWRRSARRHQSKWRIRHGWPAGSVVRRSDPVSSRVEASFAKREGVNFLTPAAWQAARHRVEDNERGQTLDEARLWGDLLSSMPLAFNVFGPLAECPPLAADLARRWLGEDLVPPDARVTARLEWSPGRTDDRWLGDRTAADAALLVESEAGRTLVCIETKYHEAPALPRKPRGELNRPGRDLAIPPRYRAVSDAHLDFESGCSVETIWGTAAEQLWRDHLLTLSCLGGPGAVDRAFSMVVAPQLNPAWSPLAEAYRSMLGPVSRETFIYRSLEQLVADGGPTMYWGAALRARYLDVMLTDE